MKTTRSIKYLILLLVLAFGVNGIQFSSALFSDQDSVEGHSVGTGCWAKPTLPEHLYPEDGYTAYFGDSWLDNPYLDWTDSTTTCPLSTSVQYQYQSYHDAGLTLLAYQSGLLSSSQIPAPGTPNGDYYWRVRAFDGYTWSDWTDAWLLTVDRTVVPASPGDVVINEIMWMGSTVDSSDEWIELRNMTASPIDIGDWTIENAKSAGGTYTIPSGSTIPASGYFLISNYAEDSGSSNLNVAPDVSGASLSLANDGNGNLVLKDASDTVIDEAVGDPWPTGQNDPDNRSMERNDVPGDGTLPGSWHQCDDPACNDGTYWDTHDGDDYGTPAGENHSENDPTDTDNQGSSSPDPTPTPSVTPLPENSEPSEGGGDGGNDSSGDESPTPTPTPEGDPSPTPTPDTDPENTPTPTPTDESEGEDEETPDSDAKEEEEEGGSTEEENEEGEGGGSSEDGGEGDQEGNGGDEGEDV